MSAAPPVTQPEQGEVLLEARRLQRVFDDVAVVEMVDVTLARGDVVGFVGKNGAGKTTTLRMLAGTLAATAGTITRHAAIGYAPETPQLDPDLTVHEHLSLCASLRGLSGAKATRELGRVMGATDVGSSSHKLTSTLSKGTKQRVGLAQALLGDPPILLLDEPSAGLDPPQLASLRKLINSLAGAHAILLSTHHVADIIETCTRVVALAHGRVVLDQPRSALGPDAAGAILRTLVDPWQTPTRDRSSAAP